MKKKSLTTALEVAALVLGTGALVYWLPDEEAARAERDTPKVFSAPRTTAARPPGAEALESKLEELLGRVARDELGEEQRGAVQAELIALLESTGVGDAENRSRAAGLVVQQIFDRAKLRRGGATLGARQQRQAIDAMASALTRTLLSLSVPGGASLGADGIVAELPEGHARIDWKLIGGFAYQERVPLPPEVTALDEQRVGVAGYMLTLGDTEDIRELVLIESLWGCCFGSVPEMNQSILVRLAPGERLEYTASPILVTGTFDVGEERQAGFVTSLYRLDDARARPLE